MVQYPGVCVLRFALIPTTVLACVFATVTRAEIKIEGSLASVRLTTDKEAISEVLSAFGGAFEVRYRTAIALDAAAGTAYSGSLGQVISRLLDGYNYMIRMDQKTIEIIVFGRRGEVTIPAAATRVPPTAGILSRWR
jgi:hypothetical protein